MRIIDADELKEKIENEVDNNVGSYCDGLLGAEILIDNTPTIELLIARGTNGIVIPMTRPTGEWKTNLTTGDIFCSCCKEVRRDTRINHINYCNSCGAEMRNLKA